MGGGLGRVTHHSEYYIDDGSVSFLTEGILFRVHRTFFQRESEVFRNLFEASANDDPPPGTDACPFTLDVTPEDFAQFLWVWYDREYTQRQQTKDTWVTILRLATRWHFDKIKELALREIEFLELPPAERISIYDDYGIDGERLISSYIELCKSPSVPTPDEARFMKMDTLIKILQAREDGQRKAVEMGHESPMSACLEDGALREIVSKRFEKGLGLRSSGTSTGSGDQALDLKAAHRTPATIIVAEPQVPDRKMQTTNQPPSHLTDGDGKGRQEKKQGDQAENNDVRKEGNQVVEEEKKKLAQVVQDREKAKKEKAAQDKEKAEKEKAEKAKEAKERAEKEKAEKDKEQKKEQKKEKKAQNSRNSQPN